MANRESCLHAPTRCTIDKLPNELLAHVFEHTRTSCCAISFATSRWRALALRTPYLWTYVRVTPQLSSEWLQILLERSGSFLLTIDVQCALTGSRDECDHEERLGHLKQLVECLCPHIDRCRAFGIKISEQAECAGDYNVMYRNDWERRRVCKVITEPLEDMCAPRLEHLYINTFAKAECVIFKGGMPLLKHLSLGMDTYPLQGADGWTEAEYLRGFVMHVSSVTHLSLGDHSVYLESLMSEGGGWAWPMLRTLTWAPLRANDFYGTLLLARLLDMRAELGLPVVKVRLCEDVFATLGEECRALFKRVEVELFDPEEERRRIQMELL